MLAAVRGIDIPPWLAAVLFGAWLAFVLGGLVLEAVRAHAGGDLTVPRAVAEGARSFGRNNSHFVGRLFGLALVGYLGLVALVARRWSVGSVALVALPLVIIAVVGFRRLGRQIAARGHADAGDGDPRIDQ